MFEMKRGDRQCEQEEDGNPPLTLAWTMPST